jgi:hypothetical protein
MIARYLELRPRFPYGLLSPKGETRGVITTSGESTAVNLLGKDWKSRLILAVDANGQPILIFYDKSGKEPIALSIAREGEPRVQLTRYVDRVVRPQPAPAPNDAAIQNPVGPPCPLPVPQSESPRK